MASHQQHNPAFPSTAACCLKGKKMCEIGERGNRKHYQWFFRKNKSQNETRLKEIWSVSPIQRWPRGQVHSSATRGLFSVLKRRSKHISRTLRGATNSFSKYFLFQFSDMRLISLFLKYCVFFFPKYVYVCTSLFRGLCCLLCFYFFLSLSLHVCCFLILRVSFHPSLHFSCAGMRMQRKTGTGDNRTESRTRDRNGTRVFRSTEVLSGNRCWKNRKKTHIFVIKRENTSDFSV